VHEYAFVFLPYTRILQRRFSKPQVLLRRIVINYSQFTNTGKGRHVDSREAIAKPYILILLNGFHFLFSYFSFLLFILGRVVDLAGSTASFRAHVNHITSEDDFESETG